MSTISDARLKWLIDRFAVVPTWASQDATTALRELQALRREREWRFEQPESDKRPGRQFVCVQGIREHSGTVWVRHGIGIAHILGSGYQPEDIAKIERDNDMDRGTGKAIAWMPFSLKMPEPLP